MLLLGLAAALTLGPASAPGAEAAEAVGLQWQVPTGCPEEEQARALVGRLVPIAGSKVRARVTIDEMPGGFAGVIELHTEARVTTRRLQAEDCTVLVRAIAVVIAVSLDPVAVVGSAREPVPKPEPVGEGPRRGVPEPGSARSRATGPEAGPRSSNEPVPREGIVSGAGAASRRAPAASQHTLEGGARLGAGVGALLLPALGVGLSLAPFIGTARLHVRAVAQYWAPQRLAFDPARDASGEVQLVTGGVRVCPQLGRRRVQFPLCAGADAGAILGRGTGRDLSPARTARGPWVGAVLEPGVTVGVTSRVSLWLALEGVVSLYRPRFAVGGAPQDWTAGAGALRGLVGVQVHARRNRPQNP